MTEPLPLVEASECPVCPHCEKPLERLEFTVAKADTGDRGWFVSASFGVMVIICSHCHKVLGVAR